jgi:hypothetical protein
MADMRETTKDDPGIDAQPVGDRYDEALASRRGPNWAGQATIANPSDAASPSADAGTGTPGGMDSAEEQEVANEEERAGDGDASRTRTDEQAATPGEGEASVQRPPSDS